MHANEKNPFYYVHHWWRKLLKIEGALRNIIFIEFLYRAFKIQEWPCAPWLRLFAADDVHSILLRYVGQLIIIYIHTYVVICQGNCAVGCITIIYSSLWKVNNCVLKHKICTRFLCITQVAYYLASSLLPT